MASEVKKDNWREAMSSLRRLTDDLEWYEEVHDVFSRAAQKDKILQHITTTFADEVLEKLITSFAKDSEFNILGVGVGEGSHELHLVKLLSPHFQRIQLYVVEPCQSVLKKCRQIFESDDVIKNVTYHWFPTTLAQFNSTHGGTREGPKFNLVSAIHSLYHTQDLQAALEGLLSMVAKDGFMICQNESVDATFRQFKIDYPWLLQSTSTPHSSDDIARISKEGGNDVTIRRLPLDYDVTDLFDESSEDGNKLLDFFTMTSHFRRLAPAGFASVVLDFWRSRSSDGAGGRKVTCGNEELLIIKKM